eukprot:132644-Pelagomonas_calceolata.AAC.6
MLPSFPFFEHSSTYTEAVFSRTVYADLCLFDHRTGLNSMFWARQGQGGSGTFPVTNPPPKWPSWHPLYTCLATIVSQEQCCTVSQTVCNCPAKPPNAVTPCHSRVTGALLWHSATIVPPSKMLSHFCICSAPVHCGDTGAPLRQSAHIVCKCSAESPMCCDTSPPLCHRSTVTSPRCVTGVLL